MHSISGKYEGRRGLSVVGICHSEPQAKNLKSFSNNLVRVLKSRNGDKDFRPFAVAQSLPPHQVRGRLRSPIGVVDWRLGGVTYNYQHTLGIPDAGV